jgi:transcriptional regulator with XRE-family HTH domain
VDTLSNFLRQKRLDQELTLRSFCLAAGCDSAYWSALERGHAPAPQELEFYKRLIKILSLSPTEYELLLTLKETHQWTPEPPFF